MIAPRIDEPELMMDESSSSLPSSLPNSIAFPDRSEYKESSWNAVRQLSSSFVVRLPIDTEPQRVALATTIAQVLGVVKLMGCSA